MISEQVKNKIMKTARQLKKYYNEESPKLVEKKKEFESQLRKLDNESFISLKYSFDDFETRNVYETIEESYNQIDNYNSIIEFIKKSNDKQFDISKSTKTVSKLNLYQYVEKENYRPATQCVFYDKDRAVVTNGHLMVASTKLFDKKLDGKLIMKNGTELNDFHFPSYQIVIDRADKYAAGSAENCVPYIYSAINELKDVMKDYYHAIYPELKSVSSFMNPDIIINMPDGNPIAFKYKTMEKFINASMFNEGQNLKWSTLEEGVLCHSEFGDTMIMPYLIYYTPEEFDDVNSLCLIDLTDNKVYFKGSKK